MERKLASIRLISDIQPIEGADVIEVCTVDNWKLVVKKGEFEVGQLAIYFEIDSLLPIREEFEFLRERCYKKMGEFEGFRLRTIKLRGQVSQGLLMPVTMLKGVIDNGIYTTLQEGDDVTETLKVLKYEPPMSAQLAGIRRGNFPVFIPKTDEERVQNLTKVYPNYRKNKFYITEKLDGSSVTFYSNNGEFGVCSRNIDLKETEDNSFWKAARAMGIQEILEKIGNVAFQGELIGESIQGNPYKIQGQRVYFFNIYDIDTQQYFTMDAFLYAMNKYDLQHVPILETEFELPETISELLTFAEGKSILNPKTEREGLVIRSQSRTISFKAISNKFLLKQE